MFSRKSSVVGLNDGLPIANPLSTRASIADLRSASSSNAGNGPGMLSRKTSLGGGLNYPKPRHHTSQNFQPLNEPRGGGDDEDDYFQQGFNNGSSASLGRSASTGPRLLKKTSSISDFGSRIISQHKERQNDKYLEKEIAKFNTKYRMNSTSSNQSRIGSGIRKSSQRIVSEVKDLRPSKLQKASKFKKFVVLCLGITLLYQFFIKPVGSLFGIGNASSHSSSGSSGSNFMFKTKDIDEIPLSERYLQERNQVSKFKNDKFRLSVPFLDTVYSNYDVGGHPIVKNKEYVKMISKGEVGKHSVLLSKEFLPSDFEMQISFVLEPGNHKIDETKRPGDGINFFFTQQSNFLEVDPTSYSQRQYMIQNDNIDPKNKDLMGIPKNLPAESLVLDFFQNGKITNTQGMQKWNDLKTPFLSFLSSTTDSAYDYKTDGVNNAHDIIKLSPNLLFTGKSEADVPKEIKLRIIKISNVLFKVDIDYTGFGLSWLEILRFEKFDKRFPNFSSNKIKFGLSALNGDQTANFQIMKIDCFNYLWNNPAETNADIKIENVMEMYRREYDILEIDGWFDIKSLYRKSGLLPREIYDTDKMDYLKKKASKNENKPLDMGRVSGQQQMTSSNGKAAKKRSFLGKLLYCFWILLILVVVLYVVSLFLRVQKKKFKTRASKARVASDGLL
ncbi:hypothetical protein ACO0QE_000230 [Hanseniaspora vineae]